MRWTRCTNGSDEENIGFCSEHRKWRYNFVEAEKEGEVEDIKIDLK
jgi:hypothetical protein